MKRRKDRRDGSGPLEGPTEFLIDRGFHTLRVDQKVVLLEIQEINERVEKLVKIVLYKLVIKPCTIIDGIFLITKTKRLILENVILIR